MLDINLRFAGEPKIGVVAAAKGISVHAYLRNVHFSGTLRVVLTSFVETWPLFSGMLISFSKRPNFEFDLAAAGVLGTRVQGSHTHRLPRRSRSQPSLAFPAF